MLEIPHGDHGSAESAEKGGGGEVGAGASPAYREKRCKTGVMAESRRIESRRTPEMGVRKAPAMAEMWRISPVPFSLCDKR